MIKRASGWYWTACGAWGTPWIKLLAIETDIPQKEKCKLCIRALQRSEKTGDT